PSSGRTARDSPRSSRSARCSGTGSRSGSWAARSPSDRPPRRRLEIPAMAGKPFTSETSVIVCDMQGTVSKYEADPEALFGWTRDEVLGKMNVGSFHVPRNVPTLVPRLLRQASVDGKFEEEVTLMRKDGSTFQAILSVYPVIRGGKQVGFMGKTRPLGPPT